MWEILKPLLGPLLGTLLEPNSIENLLKDGGIAESLVKNMNKDSIYAICITILALRTSDSGVLKLAIEALSKMETEQNE